MEDGKKDCAAILLRDTRAHVTLARLGLHLLLLRTHGESLLSISFLLVPITRLILIIEKSILEGLRCMFLNVDLLRTSQLIPCDIIPSMHPALST